MLEEGNVLIEAMFHLLETKSIWELHSPLHNPSPVHSYNIASARNPCSHYTLLICGHLQVPLIPLATNRASAIPLVICEQGSSPRGR